MADLQKYGRTTNLFDLSVLAYPYDLDISTGLPSYRPGSIIIRTATTVPIDVTGLTQVTLTYSSTVTDTLFIYSLFNNDALVERVAGKSSGYTISLTGANKLYLCFYNTDNSVRTDNLSDIMLNAGSTALPYVPYLDWQHSLRKLTTATEAVENPLYSDGTDITSYTIKGNTVQNGTPTPNNPVDVNGVGVRTENLFDGVIEQGTWTPWTTPTQQSSSQRCRTSNIISVEANTQYTASLSNAGIMVIVHFLDETKAFISETQGWEDAPRTFTTPNGCKYIDIIFKNAAGTDIIPSNCGNLMLNVGNTAKPYEPYGYKIPISNGQQTTNIYLDEPLNKIGNYADTIGADGTLNRAVSKIELTGNENFVKGNRSGWFYAFDVVNFHINSVSLSNEYVFYDASYTSSGSLPDGGFAPDGWNGTYYAAIVIRNTSYETVDEFKQYLADKYAAGMPVTVYYVPVTPTTETITAPSIPTTEGANSITVDTTVQPSEFTATWAGWHNASVKEWDGNDWQ